MFKKFSEMVLNGSYEDNEKTLDVSFSVISINEPESMLNISKIKMKKAYFQAFRHHCKSFQDNVNI